MIHILKISIQIVKISVSIVILIECASNYVFLFLKIKCTVRYRTGSFVNERNFIINMIYRADLKDFIFGTFVG